jgi:hypothetical protein
MKPAGTGKERGLGSEPENPGPDSSLLQKMLLTLEFRPDPITFRFGWRFLFSPEYVDGIDWQFFMSALLRFCNRLLQQKSILL